MATRSRKQATRGGSRTAVPAWIWLGVGVLLGLAVALVFLGSDWAPMLRKNAGPQPNPEAVAPRESDPPIVEAKDKPRKNYDFYSVLPEMEVVIPDAVARQAVLMSERYITDRFLPDKAIDLIDEAGARLRLSILSSSPAGSVANES